MLKHKDFIQIILCSLLLIFGDYHITLDKNTMFFILSAVEMVDYPIDCFGRCQIS